MMRYSSSRARLASLAQTAVRLAAALLFLLPLWWLLVTSLTRSGGTSGVVKIGRPTWVEADMSRSSARSSAFAPRSISSGRVPGSPLTR